MKNPNPKLSPWAEIVIGLSLIIVGLRGLLLGEIYLEGTWHGTTAYFGSCSSIFFGIFCFRLPKLKPNTKTLSSLDKLILLCGGITLIATIISMYIDVL